MSKKNIKKLQIKNYLNEQLNTLQNYCTTGGKFLITAPTGTGKTFTFMSIGQNLLNSTKNEYVFIFATPTKIQSQQNGINYKAYTVVSGVHDIKLNKVNTVVYDKLNVIINNLNDIKHRKIILIVDEAHELIYSKKYRSTAIEYIKKLEIFAHTTIYLTATERSLQNTYEFDGVIKINKNEDKKQDIHIYKTNDIISTLITKIDNNKKYLILINNKSLINNIKQTLASIYPNKNIVTFTSDDKNSPEFNYLVENNKINENIDIALCTNILNAGINIKNQNIELICCYDKNNWNLDLLKQFMGRTRDVSTKINIIIKDAKAELIPSFKNLNNINKQIHKTIEQKLKVLKELYWSNVNIYNKYNLKTDIETWFNNYVNNVIFNAEHNYKDTLSSCIEIDPTEVVKKDNEQITEVAISKYDSQFLTLDKNNIMILERFLNANITVTTLQPNKKTDAITQQVKQIQQDSKKKLNELKKEITAKLNLLSGEDKKKANELLKMIIINEDYIVYKLFKDESPNEVKELVNRIKSNVKLFNKLKKIYNQYHNYNPHCIIIYIEQGFKNETLNKIKYSYFNNNFKTLDTISCQDARLLGDVYLIVRKNLDSCIQKKLTQKSLMLIYNSINPIHKQVQSHKDISTTDKNKLLKTISSIYNICFSGGKYYITSLKK